ncbi:MAG TPA: hypothetical protein PKA00_00075 [Saprospiraceae bacterium]|nr:hypothetical protein [Saprospiraceae bacterium]HMQ81259.1 hypothetical protein [Saprospiraceae bacterium]
MLEHSLKVSRTAHYYTLGQTGKHLRYCWLVCHGYGQLASQFVQNFEVLDLSDTLVIAPEGLSLFYWQGFTGDPVASWMTRAHRLDEINDYSAYLSQVLDIYRAQLPDDCRIVLFGFSQGCATQLRWITQVHPAFDHLILWAGMMPEDIDYAPHLDYFSKKNIHLVYGESDQFLTPERMDQYRALIRQSGLHFQLHSFDGRHVVERKMLSKMEAMVRNSTD